jgi:hypothetical protein
MSVLVEMINVIVRQETLDHKYPGGMEAYARDCPKKTFCADDYLTRVGFMSPADVQAFIDRLVALGFLFYDGEQFVDIAVVDQTVGLTAPCDWLEVGRFPEGFSGAWLAGTKDEWTAFPVGRTPEHVIAANMTLMESPDDYEFVRHQGDVTVLRHKSTGKLRYTARSDELGRDAKDWH